MRLLRLTALETKNTGTDLTLIDGPGACLDGMLRSKAVGFAASATHQLGQDLPLHRLSRPASARSTISPAWPR
jgi:hypothetical protein